MSPDNAIVVKDLHKSYKDLKVLRGIDLAVKRGSILALLGPNGAGKTYHDPDTQHVTRLR